MRGIAWILSVTLVSLLAMAPTGTAVADQAATPPAAGPPSSHWCAAELLELSDGVCAALPERLVEPHTLVVFLHGVIKPDTDWQWAQQRAVARAAKTHGFVALMPRGRRGVGPAGMKDWWCWPTSVSAQARVESELMTEWQMGQLALVGALGRPFQRSFVFGFSNGAYYASSLALRGRLAVDGYGLFAGGSGADYLVRRGRSTRQRPPIYIGYGLRDATARSDATKLGGALRALGWPARLVGHPRVGHTITDTMVTEALDFFAHTLAPQDG